jgi:hypothetical protein
MNRKERTIGAAAMRAAVFAALIGLAAGCSSSPPGSGSPSATGPATSAAAATAPASTASAGMATASASASAAGFVGIVEPFDPGHPARTEPAPANCYSQPSTASIDECFEIRTENTDAAIDAVQQARYDAAPPAGQAAILAQDSAWLAARLRARHPGRHLALTPDRCHRGRAVSEAERNFDSQPMNPDRGDSEFDQRP